MSAAQRRRSLAAERNAAPILAELQRIAPLSGAILEVASGTGQHAAHFASAMPGWRWQPTDFDAEALPSIAAWCAGLANVREPLRLDVTAATWPGVGASFDAVFCANLIHIAPWPCCAALMHGAARHLAANGALITYGPYLEEDVPTSSGNLAFDADLRARSRLGAAPARGRRRAGRARRARPRRARGDAGEQPSPRLEAARGAAQAASMTWIDRFAVHSLTWPA